VFATWNTSTRDSGVFVRYSSPRFASKIASEIDPPAGSPTVVPATTVAVSAGFGGVEKLLTV
jgi:hypothetical protein